jgi:hypothetical protein
MRSHFTGDDNMIVRTDTICFKTFSIITIFMFIHACTIRTLREVPLERVNNMNENNIIVVHINDFVFRLSDAKVSDGNLSGSLTNYEKSKKSDQLYNELHIHADADLGEDFTVVKNSKFIIPLENVTKAEVYRFNGWRLAGNISLIAGSAILITILSFIYMMNTTINNNGP